MNAISESVNRFGLKAAVSTTPPVSAAPPPEPETVAGVCPSCGGRGWIRYAVPMDDPRFGKMFACDEPGCEQAAAYERQIVQSAIKRAGLPDKYKDLTFDTWASLPKAAREGKHMAAICAYLWAHGGAFGGDKISDLMRQRKEAPERSWVVLQGGLGTGKTGLAAAALNLAAVKRRPVFFFRVAQLFADIQGRYGKARHEIEGGVTADELIERVQSAPALILDECNLPSVSADKSRMMEEIIRYRHSKELPTLITCNVDERGFSAQWGERTTDVILELSHWVEIGGAKLRAGVSKL